MRSRSNSKLLRNLKFQFWNLNAAKALTFLEQPLGLPCCKMSLADASGVQMDILMFGNLLQAWQHDI